METALAFLKKPSAQLWSLADLTPKGVKHIPALGMPREAALLTLRRCYTAEIHCFWTSPAYSL